jgi:hypothetical protein
MNESLSIRTILTKVTFLMANVASLMFDSICFVFGLPFGTFILAHVLSSATLKHLLHCSEVLKFSIKTGFDRLASPFLLLDSQQSCELFLFKQSIFSEIGFFIF